MRRLPAGRVGRSSFGFRPATRRNRHLCCVLVNTVGYNFSRKFFPRQANTYRRPRSTADRVGIFLRSWGSGSANRLRRGETCFRGRPLTLSCCHFVNIAQGSVRTSATRGSRARSHAESPGGPSAAARRNGGSSQNPASTHSGKLSRALRMAPGDRRRPQVLVRSRRGTTPRRCRACRAAPRRCRGSGRRVSFPARTALGEHRCTDAYRRSSPRRFPGGRRTAWRNLSRRGRHIPTGPRWADQRTGLRPVLSCFAP
jgi:hypothetical protein